jgi:hypothetical protein
MTIANLAQAVVTAFPPIFEQQRIAGLRSPQLLAAAKKRSSISRARG